MNKFKRIGGVFDSKGLGYIIVGALIPVCIYLNRFLIPDTSYDSLYYHVFNGLRASGNALWPFTKFEFYPAGFGSLAPIYDYLSYLTRVLLGYRLGTVLSLLAYLGVIYLCYKLFAEIVNFKKTRLNAATKMLLFLNSIIVTELLFQLATYFVDILDTLFVLLGLFLFIRYIKSRRRIFLWFSAIIFGLTFLAKATNILYLIPYFGLLTFDSLSRSEETWLVRIRTIVIAGLIVLAPAFIYDLTNLSLTGNPVFPLYNGIFKSSDYARASFSPAAYGFGGTNLIQKILWPVVSFWHASRLAAPHNIFNDWKLGVEWLIAAATLVPAFWKKLTKDQHYLIVFFFVSMLLWGLSGGIMRYAALDDVVGGVLLALIVTRIHSLWYKQSLIRYGLVVVVSAVLLLANFRIVNFNLRYDISWRPTFLHDQKLYTAQASNLFDNYLSYPPGTNADLGKS